VHFFFFATNDVVENVCFDKEKITRAQKKTEWKIKFNQVREMYYEVGDF